MNKKHILSFALLLIFLISSFTLPSCMKPLAKYAPPEEITEPITKEPEEALSAEKFAQICFDGGFSDGREFYEYSGGELKFNYRINNGNIPFEAGIMIAADGIFHKFSADGSADSSYMHKINLKENESRELSLSFTPMTGHQGEEITLSVLIMQEPSYENTYSGLYAYGPFGTHMIRQRNGMEIPVIMKTDAAGSVSAYEAVSEKREITDAYDINSDETDFNLYCGEYDREKNFINVSENKYADLNFDVFGKMNNMRVSVFINHQPCIYENGSAFSDIIHDGHDITGIKLPVDIINADKNSSIYAVAFKRNENGAYSFYKKNFTQFFIKGEMPEAEEKQTAAEKIYTEGSSLKLPGNMYPVYCGKAAADTLCFILQDENLHKKAFFISVPENTVRAQTELSENAEYFSVQNGNLYAVEKSDGKSKVSVYSSDGSLLYETEYYEGNDKSVPQINSFISGTIDNIKINSSENSFLFFPIDRTDKNTYKVDMKTGEKTVIEALSGDSRPHSFANYTGNNTAILKTENDVSTLTLTEDNGNILKKMIFNTPKTSFSKGKYLVIYDRKTDPSVMTSGKAVILDCTDGTVKEVNLKDRNESQWVSISEDGQYILTYNLTDSFRLYNVNDSRIIKDFSVEDTAGEVHSYNIMIDSDRHIIYIPVKNENGRNFTMIDF